MTLARVADVFRDKSGDTLTILGIDPRRTGGAWAAIFVPADDPTGSFVGFIPRDFADRDIAKPGALLAFADPWSTWPDDALAHSPPSR